MEHVTFPPILKYSPAFAALEVKGLVDTVVIGLCRLVKLLPSPLKYAADAVLANITSPVDNEAEIVATEPEPINNWFDASYPKEAEYPIIILYPPSVMCLPAYAPRIMLP